MLGASEVVKAEAEVQQLGPRRDQVQENVGATAPENLADGG